MIKYITPFLVLLLIGCNSQKKEVYTFLGGKIINPKGKYVFLGNHNGIIDSLRLNNDDTFGKNLKNITEGLYYFKHGTEHQYVFLSKNDSLLLRLNTWGFDESLVFSGINANRNNALIEAFLQNEQDEKKFQKFYQLPYISFKQKADSLLQKKQDFLTNYKIENGENSTAFLKILTIATLYPAHRKIETFSIYNAKKEHPEKIPNNTFAYRNNINVNIDSLTFFSAYNNMIISQIHNDTYRLRHKNSTNEFNTALLQNIDKKITNKKLKNKLLRQSIVRYFYQNSSCAVNPETFKTFFSLSTNKNDKNDVNLLMSDAQKAQKNSILPSFTMVSANGELVKCPSFLKNNNAVLYFRNSTFSSDDWVASRFNYFIKKYPNIQFCIINIEENNVNYIEKLPIKNQYYLPKESNAHTFLTSKFSRMLLVNKKGIIENGFAGLSSEKINHQIAVLDNK